MDHADKPRKATLADVAQRASVDRSVVSRVLTGDSRLNIRDSTRARVLQAVADLHYRPNAIARSLRQGRTEVLGLFVPDFANPVYAEIIKGAESAAGDLGLSLLTSSACDEGFGSRRYAELVTQGRLDGLVLAGTSETEEIAASLAVAGVPWVMLNRRPNACRSVILDDESAVLLAMNHLLELGHRTIAHVGGPEEVESASRRLDAYEKALEAAGLEVDRRLIRRVDHNEKAGAAALEQLLDGPTRPTAIFAANVAQAIGALHSARVRGLGVPTDLAIVSIHDLRPAAFMDPPLTTVKMPLEQLGRRAVELLESSAPDEDIEEVVSAPMELVVRDSTAPPRRP
jgi:LacI family transcriptional regulator